YKAHAEVPAYREYIKSHGGLPSIGLNGNLTPDLTSIPETDKKSYVQAYSIYDRLVFGRLPSTGVTADESSGSSGTPTNWVRGRAERETVSRMMQLSFRQSVDQSRPTFILNAFALGAWATGINVSMSLVNTSNLKTIGPNIDKIVSTMLAFGPQNHYVVMGYPPFLKTLADDPIRASLW
ncbi:MAG TPA: CoF synthetase, partial [Alphaproteobacteria bacterium]|nr:CoF synthetase [Alphaproteobacteria bacterium]